MKNRSTYPSKRYSTGFSLTEVILAVGVIAVSILALLGLFGPTMSSVRDVVDSNEANGVRTRLNAALMSDEIYNVLGIDQADPEKFRRFAKDHLGEGSGTNARAPQLLYFWNKRTAYDGTPPQLVYSADVKKFEDDYNAGDVEGGTAYVVALEEGMQSGSNPYNFDSDTFIDSQGYFPILVSIFSVDPAQVTAAKENTADENGFSLRGLVNTTKPLFSYTTAKLR